MRVRYQNASTLSSSSHARARQSESSSGDLAGGRRGTGERGMMSGGGGEGK